MEEKEAERVESDPEPEDNERVKDDVSERRGEEGGRERTVVG